MSALASHLDNGLPPESGRKDICDIEEPGSSRPLSVGDETDLRRQGYLESEQWHVTARLRHPQPLSCRAAISSLIKNAACGGRLQGVPQQDRDWLVDNIRLLGTALKEVVESQRRSTRQLYIKSRDGRMRFRPQAVSDAFLACVGFKFGPEALSAYVNGWQQGQQLRMGEVLALKSALQRSVLEELCIVIGPAFRRPAPGLQTAPSGQHCIPRLITALRDIGEADWDRLFEDIGAADQILRLDPSGIYAQMTKETRAAYRAVVADLACRSPLSECQVAEEAIALAQTGALRAVGDPARSAKKTHVGYYLVDAGITRLRKAIGFRPALRNRLKDLLLAFPNSFYLIAIELLTLLSIVLVLAGLPHLSPIVAVFFLLLIPASQAAVELVNAVVTSVLPARPLPKLDFSGGIPDQYKTIVAIPALLLHEKEVRHLLENLEVRYLANRDKNLYFALLTDGPDSREPFDAKEALAESCARGIRELNRKYGTAAKGPFLLFHRQRTFNPSQNTWMGWERKRGKLLDLSRLLRGDLGRFSIKVGDLSVLPQIRYVITLDADTQLPRDAAHRLVGTFAHPLNRAVIDPATNTVVSGYGILQPRVGISVHSAGRSLLASICSGQTGFDIYTRAVSDVYQDLYGEGIFAGKGIFDVDVFQQVLKDRFPCNTLLSHDLIEGAYARAGLVSDIEVIEDYPSHFSAYSRRRHRWVRGDWQISQWLFPHVPDLQGCMVPNPISVISRWKIFDNLRRSLIDPCLLALLVAGWFFLPGHAWYWTAITVSFLIFPTCAHALMALLRIRNVRDLPTAVETMGADLAGAHLNVLVTLTFLPHQALVMIDAVIRTIVRHRITGRRLLEWETAAEAESGHTSRRPADIYLSWTPWIALGLAAALAFVRPEACRYALPFLLVWAAAPSIARWLSREKAAARSSVTSPQQRFLRNSALHIWRYFAENSGAGENWLIPDNVQEDPGAVAHRVSPTNLGLLLNARVAACEMGYLTLAEFVASTACTFSTMASLPKHRGHFFNWYHTLNLGVLNPPVVSTVDSGNLAASLWALKQACLSLAKLPIFGSSLWQGFVDHIHILRELDRERTRDLWALTRDWQSDGWAWITGLDALDRVISALLFEPEEPLGRWAALLSERVAAVRALVSDLAPWLTVISQVEVRKLVGDPKTCFAEHTLERVSVLADQFRGSLKSASFDELNDAMLRAAVTAENLETDLQRLAADAGRLVDEMDFRFLYDERKKLLSVGYDVASQKLDTARYGLLASEARMAAFIAVAKGDIPQESWLHLGRTQTRCAGWPILLSWTGTMFEYLMPTLWMRNYPRTLLEQSSRAVVEIQRAYGHKMRTPWGISESAYSVTDADGFYQYRAFGLPMLALKRARTQPRVVAPYAAYLALAIQPGAAIRNLKRLWKRGWRGEYGLYEAIEFDQPGSPTVVRCWMAHHHAMSLMAIVNCLCESPFQRLFHTEPQVMATELLLHEKVSRGLHIQREPYFKPPVQALSAACAPGHIYPQSLAS